MYLWVVQIEKAIARMNDEKDKVDKEKDKGADKDKGTDKSLGLAQWWQVLTYPVREYSTDPLTDISFPVHHHHPHRAY